MIQMRNDPLSTLGGGLRERLLQRGGVRGGEGRSGTGDSEEGRKGSGLLPIYEFACGIGRLCRQRNESDPRVSCQIRTVVVVRLIGYVRLGKRG